MPRALRGLIEYNQSCLTSEDIRTGKEHRREKRKIQRLIVKQSKLHLEVGSFSKTLIFR